jgi:hypothetical protein
MAKQYTINIGGRDRALVYTLRSARDLTRAMSILASKPVDWVECVNTENPDAWSLLVCHGLKHDDKDLVPDNVLDWFEEARQKGISINDAFVLPAKRAIGESGSFGTYFTFDERGRFTRDYAGKDGAAGA